MSKPRDPFDTFGKVRLRLYVEVEPPEYDEQDEARMKALGLAEHEITHKHTEVFHATKLFTGEAMDASEAQLLSWIVNEMVDEVAKAAKERVAEAWTK